MSVYIERLLQKALDEEDYSAINRIMSKIFPDYDERHIETLICYNKECDIHAADLYRLKGNFPDMKFRGLFTHDEIFIKNLCQISEEDLGKLNPPCGGISS